MDDLKVVEMSLLGGTPILPWDRFNSWLYGLCVVTFDLELGQAIEKLYPPEQTGLSESDKTNICYLAFPDSNSGVMSVTQFHNKYRYRSKSDYAKAILLLIFFLFSQARLTECSVRCGP